MCWCSCYIQVACNGRTFSFFWYSSKQLNKWVKHLLILIPEVKFYWFQSITTYNSLFKSLSSLSFLTFVIVIDTYRKYSHLSASCLMKLSLATTRWKVLSCSFHPGSGHRVCDVTVWRVAVLIGFTVIMEWTRCKQNNSACSQKALIFSQQSVHAFTLTRSDEVSQITFVTEIFVSYSIIRGPARVGISPWQEH